MAQVLPDRPLRHFQPRTLRQVEDLARTFTNLAMGVLVEVAQDSEAPSAARVSAAEKLLERGWGKARQVVQVDGPAEGLDDVQLERLIRRRLEHLSRVAEAGQAGPVALLAAPGAAA